MKWKDLNNLGKIFYGGLLALVLLSLISLSSWMFTELKFWQSFRIVFGAFYALFLPGFVISYIFFPLKNSFNKSTKVDAIERIALSFALSIAIVPLVIFYINLIGIRISFLSSFFSILGILFISLIIVVKRHARF